MTCAPSDSPFHVVISDVTQGKLFTMTPMQRGRVTFILMDTDLQNIAKAILKPNILLPPLAGRFIFHVESDDGPQKYGPFGRFTFCI